MPIHLNRRCLCCEVCATTSQGTKQKSFHALIWPNSSFANSARFLSRNTTDSPSHTFHGANGGMISAWEHESTIPHEGRLRPINCAHPSETKTKFCGASSAAEPPAGTLDCLQHEEPWPQTLTPTGPPSRAPHTRLSNAFCARALMWFSGSVASQPYCQMFPRAILHDCKTCRNANHPTRAASLRIDLSFVELEWLGDL